MPLRDTSPFPILGVRFGGGPFAFWLCKQVRRLMWQPHWEVAHVGVFRGRAVFPALGNSQPIRSFAHFTNTRADEAAERVSVVRVNVWTTHVKHRWLVIIIKQNRLTSEESGTPRGGAVPLFFLSSLSLCLSLLISWAMHPRRQEISLDLDVLGLDIGCWIKLAICLRSRLVWGCLHLNAGLEKPSHCAKLT